jgi:hypothetical protein
MNAVNGETGYPVIQLMTLVETGTRALIGAVFGTTAVSELDWARKLLHLLDESMLVLADRGFDAAAFFGQIAATRAQFLVRLTVCRRPPVTGRLPDGSVLSVIGGVKVRIITAQVTVTCHDGTVYGGSYGWPLPCATTALGPPTRSSASTTNAGNTRSPTARCGTPALSALLPALPGTSRIGCAQLPPVAATARREGLPLPSTLSASRRTSASWRTQQLMPVPAGLR